MTPKQFSDAVAKTRINPDSDTAFAARLVLVNGLTKYRAAKTIGIHQSVLLRAVRKLQPDVRETCPTCGQKVKP